MSLAFVGATTGVTTAPLPTGWAPGDVALAFAFRDGSTTAPTLPSGWTQVSTGGASSCSHRAARRVLVAGDAAPVFANATSVIVAVYCGQDATPVGAQAQGGAAVASVTYPALTLQKTDGSSWVVGFAGHRSVNTTLATPPSGVVLRASSLDAIDHAVAFDTDAGVAVAPSRVAAVGGTAAGWRAVTIELRGAPSDHPLADALTGEVDAAERHRIKAQAMAMLANQVGRSVTRGTWVVTLTSAPTYTDGLLQFTIRIDHDGVDVTPGDFNPVRIYNPPVLVPDPAGSVVRRSVDPDTGAVTVGRFREDLAQALIDVVGDLVRDAV